MVQLRKSFNSHDALCSLNKGHPASTCGEKEARGTEAVCPSTNVHHAEACLQSGDQAVIRSLCSTISPISTASTSCSMDIDDHLELEMAFSDIDESHLDLAEESSLEYP